MIGSAGFAFGAGPLYTNAIMGQGPSISEREHAHQASNTIFREDSIQQIEETATLSSADSHSIHCDATDQAPYTDEQDPVEEDSTGNMMTQLSLTRLPRDDDTRDLAFFLRTTGPTAAHRRPSKLETPRRNIQTPKNPFRFLKTWANSSNNGNSKLAGRELRDEGGLLSEVVEQKVSSAGTTEPDPVSQPDNDRSSGKKYLALRPQDGYRTPRSEYAPTLRPPTPPKKSFGQQSSEDDVTVGATDHSGSPIRPAASSPPTPEPVSAVSIADSYPSELTEQPSQQSFDETQALSSHPVKAATSSSLPLPDVSLPHEEFPVKHPGREKEVEIKHPSPRGLASHTVLLQRASSLESSLYRRSFSDSPGPPPPRSPLRPRQEPESFGSLLSTPHAGGAAPKVAPCIQDVKDYNAQVRTIKPTVVTECYGPITPSRSRNKTTLRSKFSVSRQERGERTRARELRDSPPPSVPIAAPTIDAIVNAPPPPLKQRLRKARPHIQIPNLRPAGLTARTSSTASSNASWKKVSQSTRSPEHMLPPEGTSTCAGEKTGYTPTSPTASNGSEDAESMMAQSPVLLRAEETPIGNTNSPPELAKLTTKSHAPRPRSASTPCSVAVKRRSHQNVQTPTRSNSPEIDEENQVSPPFPSSPPDRALPPTPPASGSEKPRKSKSARTAECKKELPNLPTFEIAPLARRTEPKIPHIATQRRSMSSRDPLGGPRIHARLEALEKQNLMLSAALDAVLRTNGALNTPFASLMDVEPPSSPAAWENRVARRSAASHGASSSSGSALEMYMSARRGSKYGC